MKAATKPPPADPRHVLTELDNRVAELRARDQKLLADQLILEKAGAIPVPPQPDTCAPADAAAMLDGGNVVVLARSTDGEKLWAIMRERAVIAEAIKLAGERSFRVKVAGKAEILGDLADTWAANIRKTAAALIALQDLAQERERLREEHSSRLGLDFTLPCAGAAHKLASSEARTGSGRTFLEAAQRAGLV